VSPYRCLGLGLLLLGTAPPGPGEVVQGRPVLRFTDFPVDSVYRGPVADINVASNADARRFRTVLRQGARVGPNFAGHMTVVTWGCGTSCIVLAVVDARTGTVYSSPKGAGDTVEYRLNSRLLVIDGITSCADTNWFPDFAYFLEWTGKRLALRDSVPNTTLCTR